MGGQIRANEMLDITRKTLVSKEFSVRIRL